MIGDSVLGEVVGADFFGPGASSHGRAAGGLETGDALLFLDLPEFGAQVIETDLAVALLVALLGRNGGNPCGFMNEANGSRDFVDVLATVATGAEELPL